MVSPLMSRKRKTPTSSRRLFVTPVRGPKRARTNPMSRPRFTTLSRQRVNLGAGPIPPSAKVALRYVAGFISDGSAFDQVFNLNSIFDPDRTGTGHQPLGRDQYATLYNRYRVLAVKVKVVFTTDATIVTAGQTVGILAENSGSAYTNLDAAFEQQGAIHTMCIPGQTKTFRKTYQLNDVTGVTKTAYKDDRFQSLMSTSPTEEICLHVLFGSALSAASQAGGVKYRVQLDMITELFDPLPLAQS